MKCKYDCLNCKLTECKYDRLDRKKELVEQKGQQKEVAKAAKCVVVHPKRGRPRKYPEGTYWQHYSVENREKLNRKERERYRANSEEKRQKVRRWREEHPDYYREWYRRRREEKLSNEKHYQT